MGTFWYVFLVFACYTEQKKNMTLDGLGNRDDLVGIEGSIYLCSKYIV